MRAALASSGGAHSVAAAMQPFSGGVSVNVRGNEGEDRVQAAYRPETFAQLGFLRNMYDRTNLCCRKQNVTPTL